jgi:Gram-negative porin
MKRLAFLSAGFAVALMGTANAQLSMQMNNGWNFTFSGNVNAFFVYESENDDGDLGSVGNPILVGNSGEDITRIRTGLLPAFAVFEAKGREGSTDLGVTFGFAPQIQCGDNGGGGVAHDCLAQIDMRQVFMTVGGGWGSLKFGRDIGVFNRTNILTDQTLYGVGATGGQVSGGTTLGRIGFGYIYPNFVPQFTYSTAGGKSSQLTIGLFDPSANGEYTTTTIPRLETEFVWNKDQTKVWIGGLLQSTSAPDIVTDETATSYGLSGGAKFGTEKFSLLGSGFWGTGIGTTFLFDFGTDGSGSGSDGLFDSFGFIAQGTLAVGKGTLAASYGQNVLKDNDSDDELTNSLISAGYYHQATKSLKWVLEVNFAKTDLTDIEDPNTSVGIAAGMLLLF